MLKNMQQSEKGKKHQWASATVSIVSSPDFNWDIPIEYSPIIREVLVGIKAISVLDTTEKRLTFPMFQAFVQYLYEEGYNTSNMPQVTELWLSRTGLFRAVYNAGVVEKLHLIYPEILLTVEGLGYDHWNEDAQLAFNKFKSDYVLPRLERDKQTASIIGAVANRIIKFQSNNSDIISLESPFLKFSDNHSDFRVIENQNEFTITRTGKAGIPIARGIIPGVWKKEDIAEFNSLGAWLMLLNMKVKVGTFFSPSNFTLTSGDMTIPVNELDAANEGFSQVVNENFIFPPSRSLTYIQNDFITVSASVLEKGFALIVAVFTNNLSCQLYTLPVPGGTPDSKLVYIDNIKALFGVKPTDPGTTIVSSTKDVFMKIMVVDEDILDTTSMKQVEPLPGMSNTPLFYKLITAPESSIFFETVIRFRGYTSPVS
ncbi:hypothetical protein [Chitinophaga flava]|uniref:Uncharacterized protein n=1 Tax=Chitinophaga flava TaxID=2259036 RepID=A0A365Y419_9BACT|nr:hypothetical protein [Chitinophaga flava]RBL93041.1 hypothetical protein DF182_10860 [Chitinophaga flava]